MKIYIILFTTIFMFACNSPKSQENIFCSNEVLVLKQCWYPKQSNKITYQYITSIKQFNSSSKHYISDTLLNTISINNFTRFDTIVVYLHKSSYSFKFYKNITVFKNLNVSKDYMIHITRLEDSTEISKIQYDTGRVILNSSFDSLQYVQFDNY